MQNEKAITNCRGLVSLNINQLKPYENNPRINDKAVDAVAASIKEFGFKVPIIIDKNNVIVAGHTRLKAAQKLGLEEVPVIVADDLTEEQIKAFRLAFMVGRKARRIISATAELKARYLMTYRVLRK